MIYVFLFFVVWVFIGGFALGAYCWPHILRWTRKTFDSFRPPPEVVYQERRRDWTVAEKRKEIKKLKKEVRALVDSLPEEEADAVLCEVLPRIVGRLDELLK